MKSRKVRENGRCVDLTLKVFELLRYLLENQGTVLSREKILEKIWGYEIYGETRNSGCPHPYSQAEAGRSGKNDRNCPRG